VSATLLSYKNTKKNLAKHLEELKDMLCCKNKRSFLLISHNGQIGSKYYKEFFFLFFFSCFAFQSYHFFLGCDINFMHLHIKHLKEFGKTPCRNKRNVKIKGSFCLFTQ